MTGGCGRIGGNVKVRKGEVVRFAFSKAKAFLHSEDGPTVTEYAVMLALIVIVCIAAISGIGNTVSNVFTNVDAGLPTGSSS